MTRANEQGPYNKTTEDNEREEFIQITLDSSYLASYHHINAEHEPRYDQPPEPRHSSSIYVLSFSNI
jgi:hypothetical protein